eukprot:Awhi_evm1s12087
MAFQKLEAENALLGEKVKLLTSENSSLKEINNSLSLRANNSNNGDNGNNSNNGIDRNSYANDDRNVKNNNNENSNSNSDSNSNSNGNSNSNIGNSNSNSYDDNNDDICQFQISYDDLMDLKTKVTPRTSLNYPRAKSMF